MPYRQRPDGNPIFNAVRLSENGVALALCSVYQVLRRQQCTLRYRYCPIAACFDVSTP